MTLREALIQAHRELGHDDKTVAASLRFADLQSPEGWQISKTEIEPGKEMEAIELFKAAWNNLMSSSALQKKLIAKVEKRVKQNQQNQ